MSQTVTVKLNRVEYRMLYQYLHSPRHTFEAIANAAINLTHRLNGKTPIVIARSGGMTELAQYKMQGLTARENLRAFRPKPFLITDKNYIKLNDLMANFKLNKTDAMSYCLRTLYWWVVDHSTDIIDEHIPEAIAITHKRKLRQTVKLSLMESVIAYYMIEGSKQGLNSSELMVRVLSEKAET